MRRRILLALLAGAACGRKAPDGGPACPHDATRDRGISFQVVISSAPAVVRRDLDLAALGRLRRDKDLGGGKPQGLTVIENRLRYKPAFTVTRSPTGRGSCAWLDGLTVDLAPGEVSIHVPREYAEGSCEDAEILRHEHQHEEINRGVLEEIAEGIRRALAQATWLPSRAAPLEVADRAEAQARLDGMVLKVIQPVYDGMQDRLVKDQAVIDLEENYRWVTRRCPAWR